MNLFPNIQNIHNYTHYTVDNFYYFCNCRNCGKASFYNFHNWGNYESSQYFTCYLHSRDISYTGRFICLTISHIHIHNNPVIYNLDWMRNMQQIQFMFGIMC